MGVYGDPRDPKVDPVDWVERLPYSETRNYVQRILENLEIYRARFAGNTKLLIEADLTRGAEQVKNKRALWFTSRRRRYAAAKTAW